jgi:hypothetical protein
MREEKGALLSPSEASFPPFFPICLFAFNPNAAPKPIHFPSPKAPYGFRQLFIPRSWHLERSLEKGGGISVWMEKAPSFKVVLDRRHPTKPLGSPLQINTWPLPVPILFLRPRPFTPSSPMPFPTAPLHPIPLSSFSPSPFNPSASQCATKIFLFFFYIFLHLFLPPLNQQFFIIQSEKEKPSFLSNLIKN